jgi:DivIVA domain-containing protein
MRGERPLLRVGEYLIARACRHLPAGARDERYREWVAELPAILDDPDVRPAARRAARMLRYAAGTIRGTALAPGSGRRVMARMARMAAPFIIAFIIAGLVAYLRGMLKTPLDWIGLGIGCLLGALAIAGQKLAYRRLRATGLGEKLTDAAQVRARAREARARTRAEARAACILQARASAGPVYSTVVSFPRRKLGPGYHAAEVDEFIARIEATLSRNARPGPAITAADVQAVTFNVTRHGGYDERVMDEVLDRYADELNKLTPLPPATAPGD